MRYTMRWAPLWAWLAAHDGVFFTFGACPAAASGCCDHAIMRLTKALIFCPA
jgi:hypothetical protein